MASQIDFDIQSATISSPSGELLLYSAGCSVFDRAGNELLPPAPVDLGYCAFGQGWLFLPWPGDTTKVIGLVLRFESTGELYGPALHSYTFDMGLNGGLGGIVPGSFQLIMDSLTWRLTAIPHSNGVDYWAIVHQDSNDAFVAFRITPGGVDPDPVISHTGLVLPMETGPLSFRGKIGPLVASSNGSRLAMLVHRIFDPGAPLDLELLQFDPSSGIVQFLANLPPFGLSNYSGVEFSPDGSKMYVRVSRYLSDSIALDTLFQYDISLPDAASILQSRFVVVADTTRPQTGSGGPGIPLCLGPDGKIHVLWGREPYLSTIHHPDQSGTACGFVRDDVALPDTVNTLPNLCKRYHDSVLSVGVPVHPAEEAFEVLPNPSDGPLMVRSSGQGSLGVFDAMGRAVVAGQAVRLGSNTFDLSHAVPGVYTVRLTTLDGRTLARSIVKN